jgi:hypothetical protein
MTWRRSAQYCFLAAAMTIVSPSRAGIWGTQPVIGISGDYSSNPSLSNLPNTAESHADALLDAPTTYNGDALKLSILPSFRLSNAQGYSSLDSDYEHLNVGAEFDTDRDVFTAAAGAARDSSLYHDYLLNGSTGVRRDTATADLNWDRHVTERFEIDADVNSMRERFGQSTGAATLTDYKYTSIAPNLGWTESELGKLTLGANAGRYNSLDGLTESTSANVQLGIARQLSEIWALSASAGYSRADNRIDLTEEAVEFTPNGPILVLIPLAAKSSQSGSIFSVNLSRQTSLLLLSANASRQLTPTGFAFLSRQDNYELKATYTPSERWTFNGDVRRIRYEQPGLGDQRVVSLQLSAVWQWTEHWSITMNASYVAERYGSPAVGISSSEVGVELSRRFNWKSFQQ